MDFFTNQWVPARRAFQPERRTFRPEYLYEAPEPVRRPSRPRFQNEAPEMSPFQPEFQYKAAPAPEMRRSPKVVQIPVRFAGDEENRSASALKIQKVFRGYLVRRSVRKIIGIKREVEAIEARVSKKEVLDLIREKDGKERLKVNESLMALLFKLDAVNGCGDSGIRLCRKAVIRKAIALQEKVDTLANVPEIDKKLEVEEDPQENELKSSDSDTVHEELMPNSLRNDDDHEENVAVVANGFDDDASGAELKGENDSLMEVEEDPHENELKSTDSDTFHEAVRKDDEECEENVAAVANVDGDYASGAELKGDGDSLMEDEEEIAVVSEQHVGSGGGDRDLVERVVEQNGQMMKMMAELFEKSEAQAKMLSSLTHRLEQLEKAYVCDKVDKIRRKKKKLSP